MPQTARSRRPKKRPPADEDVHILDTVERLKAMADPIRIRFILELIDGPRTVKEVAEALGVPPTRLYYHLRILERHGLVEVANRRLVSGIEERSYQTTADNWTISPDLTASAIYETGALRALLDVVRAEIEVAVQSKPDLPVEAPGSPLSGIGLTEIDLSPDELPQFMRDFEQILRKYASRPKKRSEQDRFHLFYALYPVPKTSSPDPE
jgi:DNA-binding transcriptional ArsR family regulator